MDAPTVGRDDELTQAVSDVAAGRGLLITGDAGVGKSHLLRQVVARVRDDHHVTELVGHDSSRHIPFGAVAHLLAKHAPAHRGLLLAALRRSVVSSTGRTALLVVDDVDRVDDESLSLVLSLAGTADATVVAACRGESLGDERLADLWRDGLLQRRTVGPLDRPDTQRLAAELLGGPASQALVTRLWHATRGNPLFLQELILAGLESGAIRQAGHYHDLDAALTPGDTLSDLVALRLHDLSAEDASALALVALTEPVDVRVLDDLAVADELATLERRRLVEVRPDGAGRGDRIFASVSHPLIGEVVRASLGHFERQRLLERVVATSHRAEPRDALRLATWLLEVGRPPDPDLALRAARVALARFDHDTTARLATSVEPATTESLVLLARARAGRGQTGDAVADLERAIELARDDTARLRAVSAMIEVLGLLGGDLTMANERLTDAIASTDDPSGRRALRVRALVVAGLGGRFADALAMSEELQAGELEPSVEAHGLMALTLAQAMTGRLDRVWARLDRADVLAEDLRLTEPYLREQVGLNRVLAFQAGARLDDAHHLVDEVLGAAVERRPPAPWLFIDAPTALHTGDLVKAARRTAESHELLVAADPLGVRGIAAALAAVVAGMRGRPTVNAWIRRAEEVQRQDEVRITCWLALGAAWARAWEGDPVAGAKLARRGGEDAIAGEHLVWGAIVLHGATRLGQPEAVVDLFEQLDEAGPLAALLARHTRASADRDPNALAGVGADCEQVGAWAVATDAWATRAELLGTESSTGARATVRAHELARRCPGLRSWPLQEVASPVTDRQHQVGRLAAAGHESRHIADRLGVATKTVDNHLQRLYATLDLAGRHELESAFPTDGAP